MVNHNKSVGESTFFGNWSHRFWAYFIIIACRQGKKYVRNNSSRNYKIGEDSTSETIKKINKTLQGTKSADRKEMKKREEYENEPLEQHNRKVTLGRSPTMISQSRSSDRKVNDFQTEGRTAVQEQLSSVTKTTPLARS